MNRTVIKDKSTYLKLSFILCCISPRDYTIYNRRKDCIGSSVDLMLKELEVISLLQCTIKVMIINSSIPKSTRTMGSS